MCEADSGTKCPDSWRFTNDLKRGGFGVFTDETATRIPAWRCEDSVNFAWGDLAADTLIDFYVVKTNNQERRHRHPERRHHRPPPRGGRR